MILRQELIILNIGLYNYGDFVVVIKREVKMNDLDKWTLDKMKTHDYCPESKEDSRGSKLRRDNVSFKDPDCQKCFEREINKGGENERIT